MKLALGQHAKQHVRVIVRTSLGRNDYKLVKPGQAPLSVVSTLDLTTEGRFSAFFEIYETTITLSKLSDSDIRIP